MTDPNILDRIDATLEDYDQWDGNSPDAARWDGDDWIDERRPEPVLDSRLWDRALQVATHHPSNWLAQYDEEHPRFGLPSDFTFPQRAIVGMDPASESHVVVRPAETRVWWGDPATPTQAEIDNATELTPYLQAVDGAVVLMLRASGLEPTEWQRFWLNSWLLPSVPLTYFPPQRPRSAAERTRSPRWRAGSRRTKRHARRRR